MDFALCEPAGLIVRPSVHVLVSAYAFEYLDFPSDYAPPLFSAIFAASLHLHHSRTISGGLHGASGN